MNSEMLTIKKEFKSYVKPAEHALFSPSAADRWLNCSYSISASHGIAEPPSGPAARQGTKAHEVCERYAKQVLWDTPMDACVLSASQEDLASARGWVEIVKAWLNDEERIGKVLYFGLEASLPIYPERDCFGTADLLVIGTKGCAVVDFKNGVGHIVGAKSPQLQVYLLSVLLSVEGLPDDYQFNAVVYQPRVPGGEVPKETVYSLPEMRDFNLQVVEAFASANRSNTQPVIGSYCHWCKVRKTCPAQHKKQVALANESFSKYLQDSGSPDRVVRDQALIKLMSLQPLINKVCKDAKEEFEYRMIDNKEIIPGLDLISKQGNRKWLHADKDMIPILTAAGITPTETITKLKSLTKVEKELGKKNFDAGWCSRPITKKLIVQDERIKKILGELANYGKSLTQEV